MTSVLTFGDINDCIKIVDKKYNGPIKVDYSYEGRTVNSICPDGFENSEITSIDMHETSIITIYPKAFLNTYSLTKVVFPDTLKEIKYRAFHGSMVEELNFGPNLNNLEYSSVEGWNIQKITVNKTNPYLFDEDNCLYTANKWLIRVSIQSTHIRDDIIGISQACFNSAKFQVLNFTETLKNLNDYAFWGSHGLVTLDLSKTKITKFSRICVGSCRKLENLILPTCLENFDSEMYENPKLKNLYIPPKVNMIHPNFFNNTGALRNIFYAGSLNFSSYVMNPNIKIYVNSNYQYKTFANANVYVFESYDSFISLMNPVCPTCFVHNANFNYLLFAVMICLC